MIREFNPNGEKINVLLLNYFEPDLIYYFVIDKEMLTENYEGSLEKFFFDDDYHNKADEWHNVSKSETTVYKGSDDVSIRFQDFVDVIHINY